jgi:hypothetical protein
MDRRWPVQQYQVHASGVRRRIHRIDGGLRRACVHCTALACDPQCKQTTVE